MTLVDPVATFAPVPFWLVSRAAPVTLPYVSSWARPRFLTWLTGADPADHIEGRLIIAGLQQFRVALPVPAPFTDVQLRDIRVPVPVPGEAELWPEATHALSAAVTDRALRFLAACRG